MSILSFVSDIGHKLISGKEDPAATIKSAIEADNPGIENLGVEFENGFVTLNGNAGSAEAVEKAILIAGNIQGVGRVVSNIVVPGVENPGDPQTTGTAEYYTIKSGDTLSAIAKHYYGDASKYPKIFEANREVIKNPDKIFVGQVIRIPPQSA